MLVKPVDYDYYNFYEWNDVYGVCMYKPDVDGHEKAAADAHAVAVDNPVAEESGESSVNSCSVQQKQVPENNNLLCLSLSWKILFSFS